MKIIGSNYTKLTAKGFTLVELMVVIAIIAVLATVALTLFTNAQQSARNSKRRGDLQAISNALESHYMATAGTCPAGGVAAAGTYCELLPAWFTGSSGNTIPTDTAGGAYCYQNSTNGVMTELATGQCNNGVGGWLLVDGTHPPDGVAGGWSICTSLEPFTAGGQVYCIHNQQQ